MATRYFGIDLGTTNSTVSVIEIEKRTDKAMEKLKTLPILQYDKNFQYNKDQITLPSFIYFDLDNNKTYTGSFAKRKYADGDRALQTVKSVKTRLGGEASVEIPSIKNPSKSMFVDMVQCSSLFLRTIRESLFKKYNEEIDDVVITVPAAFNNDERQDTINAALIAGFKNIEILDEPTAALLYYVNGGNGSVSFKNTNAGGNCKMIYDIGGGTLDITVAKISEDDDGDLDIDILARSPRMDLGGDDFDEYIASYFLSEFEKARHTIETRSMQDQSKIISRIVSRAEEEKIEFNDKIKEKWLDAKKLERLKQHVSFEVIDEMYIQDLPVSKSIFDDILKPLCEPSSHNRFNLITPVDECLKYAGINKKNIDEVIITGGMSTFYAVEEALKKYFGNDITLTPIDPISSVSQGAAIHQYALKGNEDLKKIKMEDKMADDIYIKVGKTFEKIIDRTMPPGSKGNFEYLIHEDGLTDIGVFLYYGINDDPVNYTPLAGRFMPLKEKLKKGEKINLKWSINAKKMIEITCELGEIVVDPEKKLTPAKAAGNIINNLKINPIN